MDSSLSLNFSVSSSAESKVREAETNDVVSTGEDDADELLLRRIRQGDTESLTILFSRYARLVHGIARRILSDRAEAEDVVQEVFLTVYQKASLFDKSKGPARKFIVYMTYQHALKRRRYLRTRHRRAPGDADENLDTLPGVRSRLYDESLEAHFGKEGLRKAIEGLSDGQRETLRLFFFEDYTFDEIAVELSKSRANVRHYYYRGLEKLRIHFAKSEQRQVGKCPI